MEPALSAYKRLLDAYDALLDGDWFDGRRDRLVAEADVLWCRLSRAEREEARQYQRVLYQRRIGRSG